MTIYIYIINYILTNVCTIVCNRTTSRSLLPVQADPEHDPHDPRVAQNRFDLLNTAIGIKIVDIIILDLLDKL